MLLCGATKPLAVLALLYLTSFHEGDPEFNCRRAWKGRDWEALNRLHQKGLIADPKSKAKSVCFSPEGEKKAQELFERMFCRRR